MKKVLFSALILGLVFTTSCNKDDDGGGKSCEQRIEDINEAAAEYVDNPSTNNCENYRNAIESYIDSDCAGGSSYEIILTGLDCS
ncbi:MAG TPA: hypothetical protein VFM72_09305 [Aequorivita sp.]|nr:hypothetical protein [Aequorivita sp.]